MRLVSNITDIDDQIINRANAEQRPWQEITERKCERGLVPGDGRDQRGPSRRRPPRHRVGRRDGDDDRSLVESGHAYVTDDGVYLSVETVPDYGLLAHQSLDDMRRRWR